MRAPRCNGNNTSVDQNAAGGFTLTLSENNHDSPGKAGWCPGVIPYDPAVIPQPDGVQWCTAPVNSSSTRFALYRYFIFSGGDATASPTITSPAITHTPARTRAAQVCLDIATSPSQPTHGDPCGNGSPVILAVWTTAFSTRTAADVASDLHWRRPPARGLRANPGPAFLRRALPPCGRRRKRGPRRLRIPCMRY